MSSLDVLKAEITGDPLVRAYAGMIDAVLLANLETVDRKRDRSVIPAHLIWAALDFAELSVLMRAAAGTADRARFEALSTLLSMGSLDVRGANTRTTFGQIFTAADSPASRAALIALQDEPISRAEELGIAGFVGLGTIATARA